MKQKYSIFFYFIIHFLLIAQIHKLIVQEMESVQKMDLNVNVILVIKHFMKIMKIT